MNEPLGHLVDKGHRGYICYVEDSKTAAFAIQKTLRGWGYRVDHFLSAELAATALFENNYDLLLTDLTLNREGMSGQELIEQLRAHRNPAKKAMPVMVITGDDENATLLSVFKAGANDHLLKPVNLKELDARLRSLIEIKHQFDGLEAEIRRLQSAQHQRPTGATEPHPNTDHPKSSTNVLTLNHIEPLETSTAQAQANEEVSALAPEDHPGETSTAREWTPTSPSPEAQDFAVSHTPTLGAASAAETAPNHSATPDFDQTIDSGEPAFEPSDIRVGKKSGIARFIWKFLLFCIIAAGIAAYVYYEHYTEEVVYVDTIEVKQESIAATIAVTGKVGSDRKLVVRSSTPGLLALVNVKEGDPVTRRQVLGEIDGRAVRNRLNQVKAQLDQASAEVRQSQRDLERIKRIQEIGGESRQAVENAQSRLYSARIQEDIAIENLNAVQLDLDKLKITAPINGIVTEKFVQAGELVTMQTPLFRIEDIRQRVIEAKVDATDSAEIVVGQKVVLSSDAFPNLKWEEQVVSLAPAANKDDLANTIDIKISLSANAPSLRLGQQVDAQIHTAFNPEALVLPFSVLLYKGGTPYVAQVKNNQVVHMPVKTGIETLTHTEITEGLSAHDKVINTGDSTLKEGDPVQLRSSQPNANK